jgi:conjugal transfer mating pair stabilization protein TraG
MTFEYWTFGNSSAVLQLLNAIAAVMTPSSGYVGLAKVAALLGFLAIIIGAALKNDPMPVMQWFIGIAIAWAVLFVPRVTMLVNDQSPNSTTASIPVANIPLGLAFVASAGSKMSLWLTRTAETVLNLPSYASFSNVGLMMPQRLMVASASYTMNNATLDSDWQSFFHECSYYDINMYSKRLGLAGFVTQASLNAATDPLTELGKTNKVLFVTINTGGNNTYVCSDAYDILRFATQALANDTSTKAYYAQQAFPGMDAASATNAWEQALIDGQTQLFNAPKAASETLINRWMVNLLRMRETRSAITSGNTALAMVEFGAIQAQQQRLDAYIQSARAAQDTIPTIRNVLEAITIGLFPVVLIMVILSGLMGLRIIAEWAMLFLSLQLWGFCYALMNFIMISKTASNVFAVASNADVPYFALGNMAALQENITADMAMAGSMAWAIPVICYGLVRGLGAAGMQMAKQMSSPAQSSAEQVGSGQGAGNYNVGSGSFNNTSANNRSNANADTVGDGQGTSNTFSPNTGHLVSSVGAESRVAGLQASKSNINSAARSIQADQATQQADTLSTASKEMRSAAVGQAVASALKSSDTTGITKGWSEGQASSFSQGLNATKQLVKDIQSATGADESTATSLTAGLGAGGSAGGVGLSGSIDKRYGATAVAKFSETQSGKNTDQVEQAAKFAQTLATNTDARHAVMGGSEKSKGVDAQLKTADSLEKGAQASLQQAQSFREAASSSESADAKMTVDAIAQNPEAARALNAVVHSDEYKAAGRAGATAEQTQMLKQAMQNQGIDSNALPPLSGSSGGGSSQLSEDMPSQLPSGAATPSSASLQSSYDSSAGQVAQQGSAAVDGRWAERPQVAVGGPNIQGVANAVASGQGQVKADIAQGQSTQAIGQTDLQNTVNPRMPTIQAGGNLDVPQSQTLAVGTMAAKDIATTAKPVVDAITPPMLTTGNIEDSSKKELGDKAENSGLRLGE